MVRFLKAGEFTYIFEKCYDGKGHSWEYFCPNKCKKKCIKCGSYVRSRCHVGCFPPEMTKGMMGA
jgi:hypothetical protein